MIGSYKCRHVVTLLFIASWTCHGKMTTTFLPRRVCSGIGLNSKWGNNNYNDYQLKLQSSLHSFVWTRIRGGDDNQNLPDLEEEDEDEEEQEEFEQQEEDEENKVDGEQQQDTVELSSEINTTVLGNDPQESLDEGNEDDDEEEDDEEEEEDDVEEDDEEEKDRPTLKSATKSSNQVESKQTFDEPFTLSAIQELVLTVGSMFLFNKLNLNDPKIIRLARCVNLYIFLYERICVLHSSFFFPYP
jgi:hypothetical protein